MTDEERNTLWEACACLTEWTETGWAQKLAFSIYKTTMEVLPKFKAMLDASEVYDKVKGHAVTQSDSEPVAWRWRWHSDPPDVWNFADHEFHSELMTIEPLYAAPPRPDVSAELTGAINEAIHRVLADYGVAYYDQPEMAKTLAQAILTAVDEANYQM
jgi:hypothetical protein